MPNKPSKKWWDRMVKDVRKNNPDYTDEQVDKTVGDIFFHKLSPAEKEKAMRHGSHLLKAISLIAAIEEGKRVDIGTIVLDMGEFDEGEEVRGKIFVERLPDDAEGEEVYAIKIEAPDGEVMDTDVHENTLELALDSIYEMYSRDPWNLEYTEYIEDYGHPDLGEDDLDDL